MSVSWPASRFNALQLYFMHMPREACANRYRESPSHPMFSCSFVKTLCLIQMVSPWPLHVVDLPGWRRAGGSSNNSMFDLWQKVVSQILTPPQDVCFYGRGSQRLLMCTPLPHNRQGPGRLLHHCLVRPLRAKHLPQASSPPLGDVHHRSSLLSKTMPT